MPKTGDVIENAATREKIVFLLTGRETNGELLRIDLFVGPGGLAAVEHIHPHQEERFVVKSGEITMRVNGKEFVVAAGGEAVVPPRTPHQWWNRGSEELHVVLEFRPAGRFDRYITSVFALAQRGKINARGVVDLIAYSVVDREYHDVLVPTQPPRFVQNIVFGALHPIARMMGHRADVPYPGVDPV